MKTKKLFVAFFTMIALLACTEEETSPIENLNASTTIDAKRNWQESTLGSSFFETQKTISHYSFSKKDIKLALDNPSLVSFRYVLGLENDQIIISMVGIDASGNELNLIQGKTNLYSQSISNAINGLKNSPFQYQKAQLDKTIVDMHLLNYNATFTYVNNWSNALDSESIEEMITNSGVRYRHYTLEKEVVMDMISNSKVENIALFLGLNSHNELTTVFLTKDKEDNIILNNGQRNDVGGGSYDFSQPCPNVCG